MDRNRKFLSTLSSKEFASVQSIIESIQANKTSGLVVKKLVGYPNLFRVRKETIRVVYIAHREYNEILYIGRRSEKTYKNF